MMGKIWSIAQLSGKDWKSEKLQKYLSASNLGSCTKSSGARFISLANVLTSRAIDQNRRSTFARDSRSSRPRLKRFKASSRISKASCQISNDEFLFSSSHEL